MALAACLTKDRVLRYVYIYIYIYTYVCIYVKIWVNPLIQASTKFRRVVALLRIAESVSLRKGS